jgi:hypothetical protein
MFARGDAFGCRCLGGLWNIAPAVPFYCLIHNRRDRLEFVVGNGDTDTTSWAVEDLRAPFNRLFPALVDAGSTSATTGFAGAFDEEAWMESLIWNLVLYGVGVGALLTSYMAFSPMTRDMVVFLSRDAQITIFKNRRLLWAIGIVCLGILILRGIFGFAEPGTAMADGAETLGTAHWLWLVVAVLTIGPLSLAFWGMYVPVVMAPPKVHYTVGIDEANEFLKPESIVLGLDMGGMVRAYPRDLIARPHWFNDVIDDKPMMISYCILCNSGQAFVSHLKNGVPLNLKNMTAFDNNTVYHDPDSGNFIQQLEGKVIHGPDEGEELEAYPVVMARWDEWKKLHPDTTVYYAPPVTLRDRFTQKMLETMIPISRLAARDKPWHLVRKEIDGRLPAMSFVFGVTLGGQSCAYPVTALQGEPVINDDVGGEPVLMLYDEAHDIGQIFGRRAGDQVLTFEATADASGGVIATDTETGSSWDISGRAQDGPLKGTRLDSPAHYNQIFWFSWAAFNEGTRINTGADGTQAEAAQ